MAQKDRLKAFVRSAEPHSPRLPLVHSTDAYRLADMTVENSIVPQPCSVFCGEELTYFFYGRPAFRPNADEDPTGLDHYLPVCLILRPSFLVSVRRVFPFDSGAFNAGFYGSYIHKLMTLENFELDPHPDTPGRLVSKFFASNEDYLLSRDPAAKDIDPEDFEARSYLELISARGGNAIDSRGSGVEVQTDKPVNLTEAVEAVILPSSFEGSRTAASLRASRIEVIPYSVLSRMRPAEYAGSLTEVCMAYYRRRQFIPAQAV